MPFPFDMDDWDVTYLDSGLILATSRYPVTVRTPFGKRAGILVSFHTQNCPIFGRNADEIRWI